MNRFFSTKSLSLVLLVAIFTLLVAACSDGADGATGPAGSAGADGPAGADGAAGSAGPQGSAGADGADGADGKDGGPGLPGQPGQPGEDGRPSHIAVELTRNNFSSDLPVVVTAIVTGLEGGESVDVTLMFGDGTSRSWGTGTANAGGIAALELSNDGLSSGSYSVLIDGSASGKTSAALIVK